MNRHDEVRRLAARQHGLFLTHQALVHWSEQQLRTEQARGAVERIEPEVWALTGVPPTWHRRVMAACLAERGMASHRTAAALWGLDGFRRGVVEVVTPRWSRRPNASVRVHESLDILPRDWAERDGIPCESVERLLCGLGAVVPETKVEQAFDDALQRRLTTAEAVRDRFVLLARRGRRGCGVLRPLLERRLGTIGPRPGEFARRFLRIIERTELPMPVLEHEVRTPAGLFLARVDAAYVDERVAIELQSEEWHTGRQRLQRDATRQNGVVLQEWRMLEFTWEGVVGRPEVVAAEVRRALALPAPVLA
jgi:hypothetical protein